MTSHETSQAGKEKCSAALSSVFAAMLLTGLKLVVGLATGSLGILSEAAHSALDLVAAGLTLYAVRLSARPPDSKHPYGHGKVENLSALAETLLLLATCVWVVIEAVERLLHPKPVEVTYWAIGVIVFSIVVDFSRSRMLLTAAKKHNSQALEADALHFATDIWSSLVVLAGLGALAFAERLDPASQFVPWLKRSDSIAALAVAGIVLHVSYTLGKQAVDVLLDGGAETDVSAVEQAVRGLLGVTAVRRIRVRRSGPEVFVDIRLNIEAGLDAAAAHNISRQARKAVMVALPRADVLVETKPEDAGPQGFMEQVRTLAENASLSVHDIQLRHGPMGLCLDLHAEVPGQLSLGEAHARVDALEIVLQKELQVDRITTHIEPEGGHPVPIPETGAASQELRKVIDEIVWQTAGECGLHNIELTRSGARLATSFHCRMPYDTPITCAHDISTELEAVLRARLPELVRVTIHMEPTPITPV